MPAEAKAELKLLTPATYIGNAAARPNASKQTADTTPGLAGVFSRTKLRFQ